MSVGTTTNTTVIDGKIDTVFVDVPNYYDYLERCGCSNCHCSTWTGETVTVIVKVPTPTKSVLTITEICAVTTTITTITDGETKTVIGGCQFQRYDQIYLDRYWYSTITILVQVKLEPSLLKFQNSPVSSAESPEVTSLK